MLLQILCLNSVDHTKDLDRDQRCHGYHGHYTKGIRNDITTHTAAGTHGKGQQEGCRHRSACHTTGVKGNRCKDLRYKKGQYQCYGITGNEKPHNRNPCQYPDHCEAYGN